VEAMEESKDRKKDGQEAKKGKESARPLRIFWYRQ
jgi:hypothetical protein